MEKSRSVLREGYVYCKHENGQDDVLYFVLKAHALSFHRRKVHKRHTPLGLLKLDEIRVETEKCNEQKETRKDSCDSNNNNNDRFSWQIVTQNLTLLLNSGSEKERIGWLEAIREAQQLQQSLSSAKDLPQPVPYNIEAVSHSVSKTAPVETEKAKKQTDNPAVLVEIPCGFVADSPDSKSVYHSWHTDANKHNTVVGNHDDDDTLIASVNAGPRPRLRSRSLCELIYSTDNDISDNDELRCRKSHTAPLDGGHNRKTFKTVDKLIDVHSTLCRQLVRWI